MNHPLVGPLHASKDHFHVGEPLRDRLPSEDVHFLMLAEKAVAMRDFLLGLPTALPAPHRAEKVVDPRALATALTKLDELVMWAKLAIET